MNVHLERDFRSLGWSVTVYERGPSGLRVLVLAPEGELRVGWRWEVVDEREAGPLVSFTLPPDVLEALLVEAGKVLPATHATERHLLDVVGVRDRLLALVESGWTS